MGGCNRYNVYVDGSLILQDVDVFTVSKFTGMRTDWVSTYANKGQRYQGKYVIEISRGSMTYDLFYQKYGIPAAAYDRAMREFREKYKQ